jgi:hypothetical protein
VFPTKYHQSAIPPEQRVSAMTQDPKFGSNYDQGSHEAMGSKPPRLRRSSSANGPALVLVGLVILATTAIAARAAIVSIAPPTGAAYALAGMPVNLRGLAIADVRATTQKPNNLHELLVTGEIANLRDKETPAPALRLALRADDGRELYVWTARSRKSRLSARERVTFRARLAAPPAGVRDVLVKFAAPGDKGAFTESP